MALSLKVSLQAVLQFTAKININKYNDTIKDGSYVISPCVAQEKNFQLRMSLLKTLKPSLLIRCPAHQHHQLGNIN